MKNLKIILNDPRVRAALAQLIPVLITYFRSRKGGR